MKGLWLVPAAALALGACVPDFAERGDAPVILRITKISAQTGGTSAGSGSDNVLNSDVNPVFNDNANLNFDVIYKNQNGNVSVTNPNVNDVMVEQYEVRYFRTDGRNQEGVDVPYRITGGMATLIPAGETGQSAIVVVRHQAKLEPPLKNLATPQAASLQGSIGWGAIVLTVMAEITVRGHTTSGKAVEASGLLQINFADFVSE